MLVCYYYPVSSCFQSILIVQPGIYQVVGQSAAADAALFEMPYMSACYLAHLHECPEQLMLLLSSDTVQHLPLSSYTVLACNAPFSSMLCKLKNLRPLITCHV